LAAAAVGLILGCGGDSVTGTLETDPLVDTYALQSVGGKPVPAVTFQSGTSTTTVTKGSLELTDQGTFRLRWTRRTDKNGVEAELAEFEMSGTWSKLGASSIALTEVPLFGSVGNSYTVAISGVNLTATGTYFSQVGGDFVFGR
jgi:hypothetical protein